MTCGRNPSLERGPAPPKGGLAEIDRPGTGFPHSGGRAHRLSEIMTGWKKAADNGELYAFGLSKSFWPTNLIFAPPYLKETVEPGKLFQAVFDNRVALHDSIQGPFPVLSPEKARPGNGFAGKIVIMANDYYGVKKQLRSYGLKEYDDFLWLETFLSLFNFGRTGEIRLRYSSHIVNTTCNLHCSECSQIKLLNHNLKTYSASDLAPDVALFFQFADFVLDYTICGGEPFINKHLKEHVSYIGQNYRHRMHWFSLITNGTILPDGELLDLLQKYAMTVSISDYSEALSGRYAETLAAFTARLDEWGIRYRLDTTPWGKCYIEGAYMENLLPSELAEHHLNCQNLARCAMINDSRFHICVGSWIADQAGVCPLAEDDALNLKELDPSEPEARRKFLHFYLGLGDKGYVDYCRKCFGRFPRTPQPVPRAVQVKKAETGTSIEGGPK